MPFSGNAKPRPAAICRYILVLGGQGWGDARGRGECRVGFVQFSLTPVLSKSGGGVEGT